MLCISAAFLSGCMHGENVVRSQEAREEQQAQEEAFLEVRKLSEKFKTETLPQLHLEGKTGRSALDILSQAGFQCTLIGEQKDVLWPEKLWPPYVDCTLVLLNKRRIFGRLLRDLTMQDWKADGIPLSLRYDQLASAKVRRTSGTRFPVQDDQDSPTSIKETNKLNQTIVISTPNQPMAEVVKFAMLNHIACKTTVDDFDQRSFLDCVADEVTPTCAFASIRIEVTEGADPSAPFSLWDTDRKVKGKQGPWICHHPTNNRKRR